MYPIGRISEEANGVKVEVTLKQQGGLLPHIITNHGDSFTPRKTLHTGINFSIC